jgi:hypothetical protein
LSKLRKKGCLFGWMDRFREKKEKEPKEKGNK